MVTSKLPVKNRRQNHWFWGAGYETVTLFLITQYDGERKIRMSHPNLDGGYQWNWSQTYFHLKLEFPLSKDSANFSYYNGFASANGSYKFSYRNSFSLGIGFFW